MANDKTWQKDKTCPLCSKPLSLYQINLNSALYMCPDLECKYPVGSVGYDCIVVERKLEDIDKTAEASNEKPSNLDNWMDDFESDSPSPSPEPTVELPNHETCEETMECVDNQINELSNHETCEETMESVDNLINEAVNRITGESLPFGDAEMDYDDLLDLL